MQLRRTPLRCEELGSRILPSMSPINPPADFLAGQARGTFTVLSTTADAGADVVLEGTANLQELNPATVRGTIHPAGSVAFGHATGSLTFEAAAGSVTISLIGPEQAGLSPLPDSYRFKVVAATGSFHGHFSFGQIALALDSSGDWTAALSDKFLTGIGQGTATSPPPFPDAGIEYSLTGTADLAGMGLSTISGNVSGVGFIYLGRAQGNLTVSNGEETLQLSLLGPEQHGFSELPEFFHVSIVSANGGAPLHVGVVSLNFDANNNWTATFSTVIAGFSRPIPDDYDHLGNQVDSLYRTYLHRDADPFGRGYWIGVLSSGTDLQTAATGFLLSEEYLANNGATNALYIQSLYSNILGRMASADEIAAWILEQNRGLSNIAMAQAFLVSDERYGLAVRSFYIEYLNRTPDEAGFAHWFRVAKNGTKTLDEIAHHFLESTEYQTIIGPIFVQF